MKISDYLNNEVVDYASYSVLRSIASHIDGLKNSHRKVIHYISNMNSSNDKKVSSLSGEIMNATEYLHGDIAGSVITLAKNYPGTNNLPLLTREGNFGTRFTNEASATRYIYTNKEKYFDQIFLKDYNNILIEQYFEGVKIEPMFFVPVLPLILINGSEGIATGFAQKILPRNLDNIIKVLKLKIENKKIDKELLNPYFNDFNGTIIKGENDNQWIINGKFKRLTKTKFEITELPIGIELDKYISFLDKLEDEKFITSYKDMSRKDKFLFEINMPASVLIKMTDDDILNKFKLTTKVTENLTTVNEFNRVQVFNDTEELLESYIDIRLKYIQLKKDYNINDYLNKLQILNSKAFFILMVLEGKIIINNRSKDDIIKQIEVFKEIVKIDDSYDYLLRMPIYSLTKEKVQELKEDINKTELELQKLKDTSIKEMWLDEIKNIKF